jgi:hypothetical protein
MLGAVSAKAGQAKSASVNAINILVVARIFRSPNS